MFECQAGFRKGRGCLEHLYTLMSLIQISTRKQGKLYALFVDIEQAFDSADHNIMCTRLHEVGISGKLVRVVGAIYECRSMFQNHKWKL